MQFYNVLSYCTKIKLIIWFLSCRLYDNIAPPPSYYEKVCYKYETPSYEPSLNPKFWMNRLTYDYFTWYMVNML